MADTAWVAFGSAIAGATIGGTATAVAAWAASASARRHNARAKIYLELLPEYRRKEQRESEASKALDELRRTAVVSGPRCLSRALDMREAFDRLQWPQAASDPGMIDPSGSELVDPSDERAKLEQVIKEFDTWLEGRLGPPYAWLAPWTWERWPWQPRRRFTRELAPSPESEV